MLNSFSNHIKSDFTLDQNASYLVAVSGGVDSMVLLDLLINEGLKLVIAHCNYGLRGEESDRDEAFVREKANQYGVPIEVKNFTKAMTETSSNTQLLARQLRYAWFEELIHKGIGASVFVAHHQNDSVETNLYNFVKGTGPQGLSPMKLISGNILRPLLIYPKQGILDYAEANDLKWRDDSSNQTTKYSRNKIRREILPKMEEINPGVIKTLYRNSERQKAYRNVVQELALSFVTQKKEGFEFSVKEMPQVDVAPLVYELLQEKGLTWSQAESIRLALNQSEGKVFLLGEGRVFVEQGLVKFIDIVSSEEALSFESEERLINSSLFRIKSWSNGDDIVKSNAVATMDLSKIEWPLEWREWKNGDVIRPIGMKGKKKLVSDVLIDSKIPPSEKDCLMILANPNEVLWVPQVKFSESVAVSKETKKGLVIRLHQ